MVKRTRLVGQISTRHHIRVLKAYARHHTTALKWIGRELKKAGVFVEKQIGGLAKAVLSGLTARATKYIE